MIAHAIWCQLIARADQLGEKSWLARELYEVIRVVLGHPPAKPWIANTAITDPRSAHELSAAYLREYERRLPRPPGRWLEHILHPEMQRGRAIAAPRSENPAPIACAEPAGLTREA